LSRFWEWLHMPGVTVFAKNVREYDCWFYDNKYSGRIKSGFIEILECYSFVRPFSLLLAEHQKHIRYVKNMVKRHLLFYVLKKLIRVNELFFKGGIAYD